VKESCLQRPSRAERRGPRDRHSRRRAAAAVVARRMVRPSLALAPPDWALQNLTRAGKATTSMSARGANRDVAHPGTGPMRTHAQ
jgi:hypothetical protein